MDEPGFDFRGVVEQENLQGNPVVPARIADGLFGQLFLLPLHAEDGVGNSILMFHALQGEPTKTDENQHQEAEGNAKLENDSVRFHGWYPL